MTTLAAVTQCYDDAGNLTPAYSADRGTSYKYRYDHHNRLTGVYDSTDTTRKAASTWDGLGRRIEHVNDVLASTTRYFFDGVNEIAEFDGADDRQRHYVHGVSYIDERLMMYDDVADRPYYYVVDRMFNVRSLIDRAGSIVERYAYDSYGRPRIRESCGRGDLNQDSILNSTDTTRFASAKASSIWDPRADLDDDGDVDTDDEDLYDAKLADWGGGGTPTVTTAQAFSDVDNPYMFQGVPHFAIDTASNATEDKISLNHHRARFADCLTGRWMTRDPLKYNLNDAECASIVTSAFNQWRPIPLLLKLDQTTVVTMARAKTVRGSPLDLFIFVGARPESLSDPRGMDACDPIGDCHNVASFAGCTYHNHGPDLEQRKQVIRETRAQCFTSLDCFCQPTLCCGTCIKTRSATIGTFTTEENPDFNVCNQDPYNIYVFYYIMECNERCSCSSFGSGNS